MKNFEIFNTENGQSQTISSTLKGLVVDFGNPKIIRIRMQKISLDHSKLIYKSFTKFTK